MSELAEYLYWDSVLGHDYSSKLTGAQLYRYSCTTVRSLVYLFYANRREISHQHNKTTLMSGDSHVGGRNSHADIALCPLPLMMVKLKLFRQVIFFISLSKISFADISDSRDMALLFLENCHANRLILFLEIPPAHPRWSHIATRAVPDWEQQNQVVFFFSWLLFPANCSASSSLHLL